MYVTHLKSLALEGANPTILYVYGGFGESQLPVWTPEIVAWLSIGGVYAVVNARGGGEYGEAWHRAGTVLNKQHSVDDVIAAAQELARDGYADSAHIALRGDSNGGLVAADAALQRPRLFAAFVTREGLLDLVRYDSMLHGDWWADEFGSKSASAAQFANIVRLSPVAAARPGISYPAALIQTGDEDATVSPAHAFKFVATMQADQAGPNPILLRVDPGVGHGGGESLAKVIDESVDQYSFLLHIMGVKRLTPL
jgi:prolyl oligopeptidase